MLGLTFSSKLDGGFYIISVGKKWILKSGQPWGEKSSLQNQWKIALQDWAIIEFYWLITLFGKIIA